MGCIKSKKVKSCLDQSDTFSAFATLLHFLYTLLHAKWAYQPARLHLCRIVSPTKLKYAEIRQ